MRAGSLNQRAAIATASSEPILKVAYLTGISKRKMVVVRDTHKVVGSSHLPLPVSL